MFEVRHRILRRTKEFMRVNNDDFFNRMDMASLTEELNRMNVTFDMSQPLDVLISD